MRERHRGSVSQAERWRKQGRRVFWVSGDGRSRARRRTSEFAFWSSWKIKIFFFFRCLLVTSLMQYFHNNNTTGEGRGTAERAGLAPELDVGTAGGTEPALSPLPPSPSQHSVQDHGEESKID